MTVDVKQLDGKPFEMNAIQHWLKALNWKMDFVANSSGGLVYQSGNVTITMHGFVAANDGEEPKGWDLNNSQIREIEFADGTGSLQISGFAMDLRETINATCLDSFRNWRYLADHGHYKIVGTNGDDAIVGADEGTNLLVGGIGNDDIYSTGIHDQVHGGRGRDEIYIKNDGDAKIWGGRGDDIFVFRSAAEGNQIGDFRQGRDLLYISSLTRSLTDAQGSHVRFVGDGHFSGSGFEVGFEHHYSGTDGQHGTTAVELSVHGKIYDLVSLHGTLDLTRDDFLF